ncbi:TetR family transcriptional regulator [Iamia sp. SCSIO 61187]|uniref:helix-turn-helix domain-containing protein n=1 Tax=Iamia sp. SCSIO 61187 TaxID=2722752 RepID=UPI001C6379C2|nr:helix-turn-helix domain-containing protein [Iamia sp. SCSIO 61187]QYG93228.1 TetR family transcriptional regulator [Iamia sp. SCSIO 61187]
MSSPVRDHLISAAERLFAERGSDVVSLREINTAAGSTNASAIQYHFGGRTGLIRAVLEKHDVAIEARRHDLLDAYESEGGSDLRALCAALVRPLAAELDVDGGPGYLQLCADLFNRPNPTFDLDALAGSSYGRWRDLAQPLLSPEAVRLHRRFDSLRFTVSELARRSRTGRRDHRLFTSHLTDLVTALLAAPVSDQTKRLLRR